MTTTKVSTADRLNELKQDWNVRLEWDGERPGWVLWLQTRGDYSIHQYEGQDLDAVVARAHAGEPADRVS